MPEFQLFHDNVVKLLNTKTSRIYKELGNNDSIQNDKNYNNLLLKLNWLEK